jgi:outer membrane protein assembly factor BamB
MKGIQWVTPPLGIVIVASLIVVSLCCASTPALADWPQWRGPSGTGVASEDAAPPLEWSNTRNVRWKVAIPGRGHSTPIVSGDRIFLTAAIAVGEQFSPRTSDRPGAHDNLPVTRSHRFVVIAIDRVSGGIVWQKTMHETVPREGGHNTASQASASPVTDGKYLYVHFGSQGLYCLDFDGNIVWQQQLGQMHTKHGHGEGSSPALYGDSLIVNWDHEEQSFLLALDKTTGVVRWRRDRDEVTSWSTPLIVEVDGAKQVLVCGTDRVRSYSLETGEVIWECGGMSANIVATPVAAEGMVYVGSSYEKRALMAIRLGQARGDITSTDHVVWSRSRGTPYVPSPLLYDGALYFLTHYQNVITRVQAKTGQDAPGAMRLGELRNIYASPVAAGGYVFVTDLDGTTQVLSNTEIPRSVAVNVLGESVSASAAIVGTEMFLRGDKHLFCIAEQ